jgi:tRNA ligase
VLDSIPAVREFTDEVSKEGEWNGEPLEGFVVRTHVSEPPTKGSVRAEQSPYAPGTDYFFKVKFDEPYMMYRDWREVTKALLSQNGTPNPGSLNKKKMQRPETKVYVKWIVEEIKRDRRQFEGYMNNHGIIATRERFLEWLASREGEKSLKETSEIPEGGGLNERSKKEFGKTIIVPIAIPGVGKTAISVALAHLFGFGHTQSDDVTTKKSGPTFVKNVLGLLKKHDVVIADKCVCTPVDDNSTNVVLETTILDSTVLRYEMRRIGWIPQFVSSRSTGRSRNHSRQYIGYVVIGSWAEARITNHSVLIKHSPSLTKMLCGNSFITPRS